MDSTWVQTEPIKNVIQSKSQSYFVLRWSDALYRYKHRVLCYLLSHINALNIPNAQIALLKAIEAISDGAKAHVLLPTIHILLSPSALAANENNSQLTELSDLVISCFDVSTAKDLNNEQDMLWDTFVAVLRVVFRSGQSPIYCLVLVLTSR
jgi:U3 small nucleolar RNA-associated protein 10